MVHEGTCIGPCAVSERPDYDPFFEQHLEHDGKNYKLPISPCPTERHMHMADGLKNPHIPSWNKTTEGIVPEHMS